MLVLCPERSWASPLGTSTSLVVLSVSNGRPVSSIAGGSAVKLVATVTVKNAGTPVTAGQVRFCDLESSTACSFQRVLNVAQLMSTGEATFVTVASPGHHQFAAFFVGTSSRPSSSSAVLPLAVADSYVTSPSVTIASSGTVGNFTLSATVTPQLFRSYDHAPYPTGTISFIDTNHGNAVLAAAPLTPTQSQFSFTNSSNTATGREPEGIVTADFNGDGIPDLAIANYLDNTVTVELGKGDGTFSAISTNTVVVPKSMVVGDFNGDGIPDIAAISFGTARSVSIFLGHGDGTFTTSAGPATGSYPFAIASGDFNQDGIADLAVANASDGSVSIMIGSGTGTFNAFGTVTVGSQPESVVVADFNDDGIADLAVGNVGSKSTTILLGKGDGSFKAAAATLATPGTSLAVGDFNGDGHADLAAVSSTGLDIFPGNGDGTFQSPRTVASDGYPGFVATGDFNGDGLQDVAFGTRVDAHLLILAGDGTGAFTQIGEFTSSSTISALAVADLNGDGLADAVVANINEAAAPVVLSQVLNSSTATATPVAPSGVGDHLVDASFAATSDYLAAVSGTTTLTVPPPVVPTIAFSIGHKHDFDAAFTVSASSNSSGSLSYRLISGSASASLSGNTVTLTGTPGTVVIEADQAAATGFAAGMQQTSFGVLKGAVWVMNKDATLTSLDLLGSPFNVVNASLSGANPAPYAVAVDSNGAGWVTTPFENSVGYFNVEGSQNNFGYAGAGIVNPTAVALDGSENIWIANSDGSVSELSNAGYPAAAGVSFHHNGSPAIGGIALDRSGGVWITQPASNSITELLGAATPVVPLATGTQQGTAATRP